jgi:hypothetical protein
MGMSAAAYRAGHLGTVNPGLKPCMCSARREHVQNWEGESLIPSQRDRLEPYGGSTADSFLGAIINAVGTTGASPPLDNSQPAQADPAETVSGFRPPNFGRAPFGFYPSLLGTKTFNWCGAIRN